MWPKLNVSVSDMTLQDRMTGTYVAARSIGKTKRHDPVEHLSGHPHVSELIITKRSGIGALR